MGATRILKKLIRDPHAFVEDLKDSWLYWGDSWSGLTLKGMLPTPKSEAGRKKFALQVFNFILKNSGDYFDLRESTGRERSAAELRTMFFELVSALQPKLFVEAGAKDASSSRRARELLPDTAVLAFEPNPHTYHRFNAKYGNDNRRASVEYRQCALSNHAGSATLNVRLSKSGKARADGKASLLKHRKYALGHEQVEVATTTLDALHEEFDSGDCIVQIDVEGASGLVLEGGNKIFREASAVLIRVADMPFWDQQWITPQVDEFMYDAGLFPVARDFQRLNQYNILYVRGHLLDDSRYRRVIRNYHARVAGTENLLNRLRRSHMNWLAARAQGEISAASTVSPKSATTSGSVPVRRRRHTSLHGDSKIPVFCFWEPRNKLPPYLALCMETWERHFTEFEPILMDYSNMDRYHDTKYHAENLRRLTLPQQADAIRCAVLRKNGGLWLDCDTIALRSAAPLVAMTEGHELISFGEDGTNTGINILFAPEPDSEVLGAWADAIGQKLVDFADKRGWDYVGNSILNPWVESGRFSDKAWKIYDWRDYGVFAENLYLNELGVEAYKKFWFECDESIEVALHGEKQFLVELHNSWTPKSYREQSREWLVGDSTEMLSRLIRYALLA